jgi:hypothetical protein
MATTETRTAQRFRFRRETVLDRGWGRSVCSEAVVGEDASFANLLYLKNAPVKTRKDPHQTDYADWLDSHHIV